MERSFGQQRMVKDITESDMEIQVLGYVKEIIDENTILLDDTTGKIHINFKDLEINVKIDDLINVIGLYEMKMDGETVLTAEIVQDMNNLNFDYYTKLYELKKKVL